MNSICVRCGTYTEQLRRDRCEPCYLYWHRHGIERPEHLIARAAKKHTQRRQLRERLRSEACCDTIVIVTPDFLDWAVCERSPAHMGWHRSWAGEWFWDRDDLRFERAVGVGLDS